MPEYGSEAKKGKSKKREKLDIFDFYESPNAAELLDDQELRSIGELVVQEYELDKKSVSEWEEMAREAMDIAKQVYEDKNTPWENAANVKYPLITTSCIQYASRAYAEIIQGDKVVNAMVLGDDPDGSNAERATRVSDHMSAQLLVEDTEWEPGTDRLLHCLPALGLVFKKTYWDEMAKRNCSHMCVPADVTVHRDIASIETARRITHMVRMYKNDIIEGVRFGIYCEPILDEINKSEEEVKKNGESYIHQSDFENEVHEILEQHRWLDLDCDGYEEPYVVTVHKESRKVIRIYRRFDLDKVQYNAKDEIWKIEAKHYFTDFHFIPSPDGTFHSIGLGQLLLPINEAINVLINQLLDAGTLSNQPSGVLARNFKGVSRTNSGSIEFSPGEFKKTDISAVDLDGSMKFLPRHEPSSVLFQVLGLMIQSGKELSSVSDILQGQQDSKDAAPTTVLALIEQGLKVYSSIQKRLYRSLKKEFNKLYLLNGEYLDDVASYKKVLATGIITKEDYSDENLDVVPVSDPAMSSDAQRLARARAMLEIMPMLPQQGQTEVLRNWLVALKTPTVQIDKIIPPESANGAEAQAQAAQQQIQMEAAKEMMTQELKAEEVQIKKDATEAQSALNAQLIKESQARIQDMLIQAELKHQEIISKTVKDQTDLSIKAVNKMSDLEEIANKEQAE